MSYKKIINEVASGNGNQFSVKEILQAHVQDDKEFKKEIRKAVGKHSTQITKNAAGVKGLMRALKYGIGPILLLILGVVVRSFF